MHAVMFYFLFRNFYNETYKKKSKLSSKQESRKLKNSIEEIQKDQDNIKENSNFNKNGTIYANQYKMATGYISDNGLRNRVFIDNHGYDK